MATAGSSASATRAQESRWEARPWLARSLQVAIFLAPLILCTLVTEGIAQAWQPATHRYVWIGFLALVAIAVGFGTERVARRFLPLAALLQLTLLFPDRAPSRLKIARTSGSATRLAERLAHRPDDSASTAAEKVLSLITALGNHDRKTRGHSERVRLFTDMIATELRLADRDRDRLRWAALLHDVGKLQVAPAILNKPEQLSANEMAKIRQHPAIGAQLAGPLLAWLGDWGRGIVEHHERYDGAGYPAGLAGTAISRSGRIINVADAFETMTAARAYKKPLAMKAARAELAQCAGSQFDPEYVRAFLAISLPRLLWGVGPLSFAGQLPFLRALATAGNRAASLGGQVGVASAGVAAVTSIGVATALGVPAATVPQPHHHATHHVAVAPATHHATPPGHQPRHHTTPPPPPARHHPTPTTTPSTKPQRPTPPTPSPTSTATASPTPTPTPTPTATKTAPTAVVPHAPTDVTATAGDATATVSWSAPDSDGGSPLTHYTVMVYDNGTATRTKTVDSGHTTSLTGLTDGDSYTFTVIATNAVGDSPESRPSTAVTPEAAATVPDAPSAVSAIAGDGTATVSWTAPDTDGGSAITGYTVAVLDNGSLVATKTVHADDTSATVDGLTDGDSYTFTVFASNAVGDSAPSAPSAAVTPVAPATVPDAPTGVSATAGDAVATVTWTAPDSDGGSPVGRYTVTGYDGGNAVATKRVTADTTTVTITGLTNGDSYTFTVTAVNGVGASQPSDPSAAVTPVAPITTLGLPPVYAFDVPSGTVVVHVLKNAPAGMDPTSVQVTSAPHHGTATANSDGTVTYTADPGWAGTTTFTFSACTTTRACGTQTTTVQVVAQQQHWCDANGLDLSDADLAGVDFSHCSLAGADLSGANLEGATFSHCTLTGANLSDANLSDAELDHSNVSGVVLSGANLSGMRASNLTGGTGPTTSPISLRTPKSTAVTDDVMASVSDRDIPVNTASLALVGGPSHGHVVVHGDGTMTYTPSHGYSGTDRFMLSVSNVFGFTSTILVTVTIPP